VVLILTTVGFSRSAKSAIDPGVRPLSPEETAEAVGTSGPGPEGTNDERKTSTKETMKNPIRQASKNIIKVFRF